MIDRERFTQARYSCLEPVRSVGKEPVGELSLSSEPECLSLQESILTDQSKPGKGNRIKDYPGAQAPNSVGPFLPMDKARAILGRVVDVELADCLDIAPIHIYFN